MTNKTNLNDREIKVVTLKIEKVGGLKIAEELIHHADTAKKIFQEQIGNRDREILAMICLDAKGRITNYSEIHMGTLNQSIVHPREVYKTAILSNAGSIIIGHNHPSGDLTPSSSDYNTTKILSGAGRLLDIPLEDHIIVTENEGLSLRAIKPELFDE